MKFGISISNLSARLFISYSVRKSIEKKGSRAGDNPKSIRKQTSHTSKRVFFLYAMAINSVAEVNRGRVISGGNSGYQTCTVSDVVLSLITKEKPKGNRKNHKPVAVAVNFSSVDLNKRYKDEKYPSVPSWAQAVE